MIKFSIKITLSLFVISFFLIGCSSKPTADNKNSKQVTNIQARLDKASVDSASARIEQAQNLPLTQSLPLLVKASELFLQADDINQALWLAEQLSPLLNQQNNNQQAVVESANNNILRYRLAMVKAQSLLHLGQVNLAFQQLEQAQKISAEQSQLDNGKFYQLQATILLEKKRIVSALDAKLRSFAVNSDATQVEVEALWQGISSLSQWQLTLLANDKAPYVKGWIQLTRYSHQFGNKPSQLQRMIKQWQRRYPTHPAMLVAKQLQDNTLEYNIVSNIAIILPLTGSQQAAGISAQQGILSAYKNDHSKTLHFIDTNRLDWSSLAQTFQNLSIDYVIGPLLKTNVNAYLAQTELTVPVLLLNLPINISLLPYQTALSMRPEDEASQAASMLSTQSYQHPIVISHSGNVSKRIALTFAKQWLLMTDNEIEIIYFSTGKQMQANLKTSLDVGASQIRIAELKGKVTQTIKAESRNRRDVDMIYIVGSAQQTHLIKPYIDVNISPFATVIPVFASSRSHSTNNEGNHDLNGLTFTEMPWLITNTLQNKQLATLSQKLWPKRSDSLQGIFAMGFDSYTLIEKIPLMQQRHYIQHQGQVGLIKLDKDNVLRRSLIWARYQNDQVKSIVLN